MSSKLYVGNLSYSMRDNDLELEFSPYGSVQSAKVMMDRDTNRSKGFGFVEMSSAAEAEAAIAALNGKNVGGRDMTVNIARPMEPRSSNGGGGFRDSYGSGRRSY
ncbi:MAG: RNA-binding protein [Brachymonas sp.]|jgi:RNA recognition motif-containing protein|nr:RNA-binding protein [Brachymonas sp.]MBP8821037.1 RNA-binding protein [Brachymonas sp.]MBP9652374.1 RNA-binding protein [Brachymonas sp.]